LKYRKLSSEGEALMPGAASTHKGQRIPPISACYVQITKSISVPGSVSSRCVSCKASKQASEAEQQTVLPRQPVKLQLTLMMRLGSCAAWLAAMLLVPELPAACPAAGLSLIFVTSYPSPQQGHTLCLSLLSTSLQGDHLLQEG
jgi:hypothetical protein